MPPAPLSSPESRGDAVAGLGLGAACSPTARPGRLRAPGAERSPGPGLPPLRCRAAGSRAGVLPFGSPLLAPAGNPRGRLSAALAGLGFCARRRRAGEPGKPRRGGVRGEAACLGRRGAAGQAEEEPIGVMWWLFEPPHRCGDGLTGGTRGSSASLCLRDGCRTPRWLLHLPRQWVGWARPLRGASL